MLPVSSHGHSTTKRYETQPDNFDLQSVRSNNEQANEEKKKTGKAVKDETETKVACSLRVMLS